MIRNFTLSLFLTVCSFAVGKYSFANIITYSGGPIINYSLNANDTLYIASGTYTGQVSGLNSNNKTILVAGGATFQPSLLQPTTGVVCKIKNYGTFTYTQSLTTNTNFTLDNYAGGIVNLAAMDTKGRDQVWTNHIGGTINFSGDVTVNGGTAADDNNVFINYETINANGNFTMRSGSQFINYKDFNIAVKYTANGGSLRNEGNFVVTGGIELNSGASQLTNYCRLEASGGIVVSNGTFTNYTYVWARNSEIEVKSGGTINNVKIGGAPMPPIIHGKSYKQSGGAVTGPALMYFTSTSISGGTIGVTGATADTIKMNDTTRASPSTIFDSQAAGTVRPNVIYNAWGVPDSLRTYLTGCSVEILMEIPLAVNWRSFEVILVNEIPNLIWSAEFDKQTIFEIERSYDGRHFSKIDQVSAIEGKKDYRYNDKSVNTQSRVAYYRINAFELGSDPKYSRIKLVRFDKSVITSMQIVPNPFRNNFNIFYNSAEEGNITIRIFNISGQQKLVRRTAVNKGNNIIDIAEASQLASGMYILQVIDNQNKVSTAKLIKQ